MNPFRFLAARRVDPPGPARRASIEPTVRPPATVLPILRGARVAWLSTVDEDGTPALVPTWFWFDGEVFWLFAKPGQRKVRNIRRFERVTLAIGDAADDFAVQVVEGSARMVPVATASVLPDEMKRAYANWLARIGMTWETYVATYRQPIVVRPTRYLPWRGLSHQAAPERGVARLRPSATLAG
ncbi:MAG TPA: pyridoxamine 5'-phosphate oxidase family protein [Candidatus Limnocylindria bacterium]|nr:pyridoxamine 5'-phosphate oxidase family protein [Candidatus Limnocylindria bacterium]